MTRLTRANHGKPMMSDRAELLLALIVYGVLILVVALIGTGIALDRFGNECRSTGGSVTSTTWETTCRY